MVTPPVCLTDPGRDPTFHVGRPANGARMKGSTQDMKRRIAIVATIAVMLGSGVVSTPSTDTAQPVAPIHGDNIQPVSPIGAGGVQPMGSTWS